MPKTLILRLSSLGDIILSTASLEAIDKNHEIDWAVSSEYSILLKGHPKIRNVLSFDRSTGLSGWIDFSRDLWDRGYDEIYDLHRSLRTRILSLLFLYWGFFSHSKRKPKWRSLSKRRFYLYPFFFLKGLWPKKFRPTPLVSRFALAVGGAGIERPNLRHLVSLPDLLKAEVVLKNGNSRSCSWLHLYI